MPTYNLTELINALNKEEIRNFKLYSSRINNSGDSESKTILLFDLIKTQQLDEFSDEVVGKVYPCLLYTSPSPRDATLSRMPSSA